MNNLTINHITYETMFTINAGDKHNKLAPITHKEDPAHVGGPKTAHLYVVVNM